MQQRNKSSATVAVVLYALIVFFALFFKSWQPDYYKWILEHYYDTNYLTPNLLDRIFVALHPWRYATFEERFLNQNAYMNVLVFIPFGVFWSFLREKKILRSAAAASLVLSLFIEIAQLFTMIGNFGIGDVITNTLGGFLGALLFLIFSQNNFFKRYARTFLGILIVISIPVLIILVYNTVIHIDIYLDIIFRRI